jgi:hypothetical protein
MSAQKYDFPIEQGTSFRLALTYKDKDGNIVDLTDWCARLVWQTNTGVTQVFSTENTDLSLYSFTIDGPTGKLTFLLPAAITNSFNFSLAKYDLELKSPEDLYEGGGKYTTRILYGTINIVKRFSQASSEIDCP